jgi:trans-aconitate methyltransferase
MLNRLYSDLASWFQLLSLPQDYSEEAQFAYQIISKAVEPPPRTVLELGAGGGNNAWHLKHHFQMTLTDVSDTMLDNSRRINPECEHVAGDMRTLRLAREFDAVFVYDAIGYMTTMADLRSSVTTAFEHCRPGGVLLIMPDYLKETFRPGVHHGGQDGDGRALRYLEWTFDPDPTDSTYTVDFVYLLREATNPVRVVHDTHIQGLFARSEWLQVVRDCRFVRAEILPDEWGREVLVATK